MCATGIGRSVRVRQQSTKLSNSVVLTTLGHRIAGKNTVTNCAQAAPDVECRDVLRRSMFEVTDCVENELRARFSNTHPLLLSCDTVNPKSPSFLHFHVMKPLADAYSYIGFDCGKLESHAVVAENMFRSETETMSVNTVVKKLFEMKCPVCFP